MSAIWTHTLRRLRLLLELGCGVLRASIVGSVKAGDNVCERAAVALAAVTAAFTSSAAWSAHPSPSASATTRRSVTQIACAAWPDKVRGGRWLEGRVDRRD